MSTHTNILFIDFELNQKVNRKLSKKNFKKLENENILYIHSDGYPENQMPVLKRFLSLHPAIYRKFDKNYLLSWFATYYNTTIMTRYLNKELDYSIFDKDYEIKKEKFINYQFNVSDFDKLTDFRGSGIFIFDAVDFEYMYIVETLEDKSHKIQCENNFKIYVLNYDYKIIDIVII